MLLPGAMSPEIVRSLLILPCIIFGLLGPVMHLIVIFCGEFYSGNCM
jgi:hypothetical protein